MFQDRDRLPEEDDMSFCAMNEGMDGYEGDVFEEVGFSKSSLSATRIHTIRSLAQAYAN